MLICNGVIELKKLLFGLSIAVALLLCPVHAEETVYVSVYENINFAIDFVSNSGGGAVVLEDGIHLLSNSGGTLTIDSNVSLVGNKLGTVLKNDTSLDTIHILGTPGESATITSDVKCGYFAGTYPFTIYVTDASIFTVNDTVEIIDNNYKEYNTISHVDTANNEIQIWNRPQYDYKVTNNAHVKKVALVENIDIDSITFEQSDESKNIINIDYAKDIRITHNIFNGKFSSGNTINLVDCELVKIADNRIRLGDDGVRISHTAQRIALVNNSFENCWTGIIILGHKNIIEGNIIIGSGTHHGSGDGITVSGYARGNLINGNTIDGGDCYGLWVTGNYPTNTTITNNTVRANITSGIMIAKGEGHVVSNNLVEYNTHGIATDGTTGVAKNIIIANNISRNNISSGIIVYGYSYNVVIIGNNVYDNGKTESVYATDISIAYSDYITAKDNIIKKDIYLKKNGANIKLIDNIKIAQ